MNMNEFLSTRYIAAILFLFTISSNMLSAAVNDSLSIRTQFKANMHSAGNAALQIQKMAIDSLSQILETSNLKHRNSLKTLKDSLFSSAGKKLDKKRITSIEQLHTRLSEKLNFFNRSRQKLMNDRLQKHQRSIQDLVSAHLPCQNCKEYNDYENTLNAFQEKVDLSTDAFFDAVSDEYENASDALTETADILRDSLMSFIETLVDDRSTELEEIDAHSNKIIASVDAKSHATYRGRDGGVSQASLSPSLALALSSGLRISLGAGWTEKPEFHQDATYLGIGYDFSISSVMSVSIGYTYLWYADSSTQNQSVFHHSIDGGIYLETRPVNLGASVGISIGDQIEYAFAASISRSIPIGNFTLDPSLTITWGELNGELTAERLTKALKGQGKSQGKGKGNGAGQVSSEITATFRNIFTLMAYEINLPLNIHIGALTVTPSVSAIFPMNVNDGSREVSYLNAGLTAVYEFRL
jgi:hypothetical protein